MLGRLLNTAAATLNPASYTSRNPNQLQSVTEEEHTSGLLFPDASFLQRSRTHVYPLQTSAASASASAAGSFDDNGGLELDSSKDLRVIIAQNAIGDRDDPCILLDTQAPLRSEKPVRRSMRPEPADRPRGKHSRNPSRNMGRNPSHTSRVSISDIPPLSPLSDHDIGTSAFFRARNRRSTFSSPHHDNGHLQRRLSGDTNELGLLNCIFGSSAFSYRGPSTKMHIVPAEDESTPEGGSGESQGSQHRAPFRRGEPYSPQPRTTSLSRERSSGTTSPKSSSPPKVTVLVTRMFSVNLPEACIPENPDQPLSPDFLPFNDGDSNFPAMGKMKKIKEKKTPMYAVAVTFRLPLSTRTGGRPLAQRNSYTQDNAKSTGWMSASLDSPHRLHAIFDEANAANTSIDDRIDVLVEYWDVVARTLSHLEKLASKEILTLLKQVDQHSSQLPKPVKGPNMQRTNQTIVQLRPNSLSENVLLREAGAHATRRVSLALRIPAVVTGQSRWGVWREEARWIAKSLSEKEHNFFFLVLITAFLGNHTEWLSYLGPDWYRRRYYSQQKAQHDSESGLCNRTVIISPDKMAARRLIFVLSAFLPPQQRSDSLASPFRPGTSTSFRQTSQSPPGAPFFRQESLRRTINRRARFRQFNDERSLSKRSASVSSNETSNITADELDFMRGPVPLPRQDSDVRSIRAASLSIPAANANAIRGSTPSTTTAVHGTATPVPHFASHRRKPHLNGATHQGAGSNESPASSNLLQNLQRSDSSSPIVANNENPPAANKWGNILSGLWSSGEGPAGKRRGSKVQIDSSSLSDHSTLQNSELARTPSHPNDNSQNQVPPSGTISIPKSGPSPPGPLAPTTRDALKSEELQPPSSPVKLCVEANEGVVDVEVSLPGFLSLSSSNDSAMASPKKTRTSITSLDCDGSFHSSNNSPWSHNAQKEYDGPTFNVAGWLKNYHEDFILQAVRPYTTLEDEIKRSMSAEPTPSSAIPCPTSYFDQGSSERWVDVCSTLVADVRTFTVKRIRLRRKITPHDYRSSDSPRRGSQQYSPSVPYQPASTNFDGSKVPTPTATFRKPESNTVEEEFITEPVMDLDGTLVDAVERVLAHSGASSAIHSRAPSPHRMRKGKSGSSIADDSRRYATSSPRWEMSSSEVPRTECRRMVLGALEEVVRSVTAEHRQQEESVTPGLLDRGRRNLGSAAVDNTLREGIRKWLQEIDETC